MLYGEMRANCDSEHGLMGPTNVLMERDFESGVGRKNEVVERGFRIACDPPAERYPLASGYSSIPP